MTTTDALGVDRPARPATVSCVLISKNERALRATLDAIEPHVGSAIDEVIVVDASAGRLDDIRDACTWARWIPFSGPPGRVTIPHQRNVGVRAAVGDVVMFIDAACVPGPGWPHSLLEPILAGAETVTCGPAALSEVPGGPNALVDPPEYVREWATINLAFRRDAFERVGGFDERFDYGSDVDFTWRLNDAGVRIRYVAEAAIDHDWGDFRRRLRRGFVYGVARARLYKKHPHRVRRIMSEDPVHAIYPLYILGLPLTLKYRWYPLLLLIPLWRNRRADIVLEHLVDGWGVLRELCRPRG
jgi:glycosyltransferase involved in cell wall biosynthesis